MFIKISFYFKKKVIILKKGIMRLYSLLIISCLAVSLHIYEARGDARGSEITVNAPTLDVRIENAFATINTAFEIENTGATDEEIELTFSIPDDAFLVNLTAEMNGTRYYGQIKEDEVAQQEYEEAVESGKAAIKIEKYSVTDFCMALNLIPEKPMKISYSCNMFLVKELGGYTINIIPSRLLPSINSKDVKVTFQATSPSMITSANIENLGDGTIEYQGTNGITVSDTVGSSDTSKEIVLTYETATTDTGGMMQFSKDGEITYFLHTFAPGIEHLGNRSMDKDIVFIVDTSGSMSTDNKMEQTKEAFHLIVGQLSNETDRFNIISFSSGYELWKNELQVPDGDTIKEADDWIDGLLPTGGTNIIEALEKGLDILTEESSRMKIIVFLTDGDPTAGYIQSTAAICTTILEKNTANISIFSLGVGSDMDFDFLKKLSFQNYARAYSIDDNEDISEQISHFYKTISTPLIYRLNMDYDNAGNVYERHAPYMFEGQEHCVLGKVVDTNRPVKFSGTGVTVNTTTTFAGEFTPTGETEPFIPQLWAFMHIRWCEEKMIMEDNIETYKAELTHTALEFQIVTDYTTMIVVVEEEEKTDEKVDEKEDEKEAGGEEPSADNDLDYDPGDGSGGDIPGNQHADSSKFDDDSDDEDPSSGKTKEKASTVSITVLFSALILVVFVLYFRRKR